MTKPKIPTGQLTVEQRVAKGVQWLDKHRPGWEDVVTVLTLDMGNACLCVLGQVFDPDVVPYTDQEQEWGRILFGYWRVLDNGVGDGKPHTVGWAVRHGFDGPDHAARQRLADAWTKVINERQETS